jgi:hypothetical protein
MGSSYETEYLPDDQEANLLAAVFVNLPDDDKGYEAGDAILCELIELGLVDADVGPAVYQHWKAMGETVDVDALRAELVKVYVGEDVE